jgi:CubicO group peptidase (beta-lactamase class C family)
MRNFLPLALFVVALLRAQPLPISTPQAEGLSPDRLARLHHNFDQITQQGKRAGVITMIVRNGKIADWQTYGYRDRDARLPMEKDTICRIWSMTKTVSTVAAMILLEEGKLTLDDRVDAYIPEFKNVKVFRGGTADDLDLAKPSRPMTIKHLLTHTSGFRYAGGEDPVAELYKRAKVFEVNSLKDFAATAAQLPLDFNPGDKYEYGINIDVLGYVVQVASDMPFDRFVKARILDPLRMQDTFFVVPAEKRSRLAKTYTTKDGKLVESKPAKFDGTAVPFGGGGLYSTIGDYARFAQMLLN